LLYWWMGFWGGAAIAVLFRNWALSCSLRPTFSITALGAKRVSAERHVVYRRLWCAVAVVGALCCLALISAYLYFAPRFNKNLSTSVLFHPPAEKRSKQDIVIAGSTARPCPIPLENKAALDALFFPSPVEERGVVLFTPGVGGSVNILADPFKIGCFLENGYAVLVYDMEGYGLSTGVCDVDRVMPDSLAAYDYLRNTLRYPAKAIVGYGQSFGAGVTSELSRRRSFRAIILESTFTSPKRWADDHSDFSKLYPDFLFIQPGFDNLAMLRSAHPPALIVVSGKDQTMPPAYGKELIEAAVPPAQNVTLPNSYHARVSTADQPVFKRAVDSFLLSLKD